MVAISEYAQRINAVTVDVNHVQYARLCSAVRVGGLRADESLSTTSAQ